MWEFLIIFWLISCVASFVAGAWGWPKLQAKFSKGENPPLTGG